MMLVLESGFGVRSVCWALCNWQLPGHITRIVYLSVTDGHREIHQQYEDEELITSNDDKILPYSCQIHLMTQ